MYVRSQLLCFEPSDLAVAVAGKPAVIRPFLGMGTIVDMQVYLSTSSEGVDKMLWAQNNVALADRDINLYHSVVLTQDDLAPVRFRC